MLSLSVSKQNCAPWAAQKPKEGEKRPMACFACSAPGGSNGELLEAHTVGKKTVHLCPLCHACLHLDIAGKRNAGRVVWLPELTQERLNLVALATFIAVRKSRQPAAKKNPELMRMVNHALRVYEAFERRSEVIETLLLSSGSTAMPRANLSSPIHIASLLTQAQKSTGFDAKTIAQRIEGLRLLPAPAAFESYIASVARIAEKAFPVNSWMQVVAQHEAPAESASAHFNAEELTESSVAREAGDVS